MSRLSLVEGIACGVVEINFQDLHGVIGCIENFQDVTYVIYDVTLLDTQKTGEDIDKETCIALLDTGHRAPVK